MGVKARKNANDLQQKIMYLILVSVEMDDGATSHSSSAHRVVDELPDLQDSVGGAAHEAFPVRRNRQARQRRVLRVRSRSRQCRVGQVTCHATVVDVPNLKCIIWKKERR